MPNRHRLALADPWSRNPAANTTNPLQLGAVDVPGATDRLVVSGRLVYVAAGSSGLRVLEMADPSRPAEVGAYLPLGPRVARSVAVAGGYAYVGADELDIVDLTDPARPAAAGRLPGTASRWDSGKCS